MSANLRVLTPQELPLIAGGSMGTEIWDPNYAIAPPSSYSGMGINVPVFSATSWTTSSYGANYGYYNYLAGQLGYDSANAFLQYNPYTYNPQEGATHVNYYGYVNGYTTTETAPTTTTSNLNSVTTSLSYAQNGDIYMAPPPPPPEGGEGFIYVNGSVIRTTDPSWHLFSSLIQAGTGTTEIISLTNSGSTVDSTNDEDRTDQKYDVPGFETEVNYFHQNKAQLIADIRAKPDALFKADILINGKMFHIEVSTHAFANALEDYDFYFNFTYQGDNSGVGSSYAEFSVLDPYVFLMGANSMTRPNLNWVAMHEFAHQILSSVNNELYQSWYSTASPQAVYNESVPQMVLNEQYTDALLSAIAGYVGIQITSNVSTPLPSNPFIRQP